MSTSTNKTNVGDVIKVTKKDLPLSCPQSGDDVSNMHPRVFLPIKKTGDEVCPYCGAHYVLDD